MAGKRSARFSGLVDLASAGLGGRALACSDDFFAGMQNMLKDEPPVFLPDEYTERGKWMDGWESRRKRSAGHDHCLIALGAPGRVLAFDLDTSHFLGNHPPYASVEGLYAPPDVAPQALAAGDFHELLPQSPLLPGSQNLFVATPHGVVTHVRLNIFPDGGVARFRVYGHVEADLSTAALDLEARAALPTGTCSDGWLDLCALTSGGMTLAGSDAFYGPTHNLILPGRAANMGGGWETRRRRGEGHDWVLLRLGARGTPKLLEIDTNHFKGNYPARCSLELLDAESQPITELIRSDAWRRALPEVKLEGHARQFFYDELKSAGPATYARLRIFPDGGISRMRLWGVRDA